MPATVWKGYLTFGLVSFPIRLFAAARPALTSAVLFAALAFSANAQDGSPKGPLPPPPPPPYGVPLASLKIEGVSSQEQQRLQKAISLRPGMIITPEALRKARMEVGKIDPHLLLYMTRGSDGKVRLRFAPPG